MYYLENESDSCLASDIIAEFKVHAGLEDHYLLVDGSLIDEALELLVSSGGLELDNDEYGPPIITFKRSLNNQDHSAFDERERAVITRFGKARNRQREWLLQALRNLEREQVVNERAPNEETADNQSNEDESDWEPLPLDRQDPELANVIEKIDKLAEGVRADNGYAAHHAGEKKFVLDKLQCAAKALKEEAAISWTYLREFAVKPIAILIKRFGPAAIGIAAEAAKAAIKEWLKKKGLNFLDGL